MRSPRTSSTKSSTSYYKRKIQIREDISEWVRHEDPEFEAKKVRTRIIRVAAWAWTSKTTLIGSQSICRSSSTREKYICVADWRWRNIIKKAMREVAEKLNNGKDAAMRKEIIPKNDEDWKNFLRSMIRNHEQWVYSSTILTHWAVLTDLRSSSCS